MLPYIVVIAVNEQLVKIPLEYNENPISQKPKSERKPNAKIFNCSEFLLDNNKYYFFLNLKKIKNTIF